MATQYAVLHTEKGKASGGGLGHHIDRTPGMQHTYPHADPSRLNLNQKYPVHMGREKIRLSDAIQDRIREGYKGKKAIRKDAVRYLSTVLTGSHERMKEMAQDPVEFGNWIKSNYEFACHEFGKENIVRFTVHLDEKTPHIHCVHVPLTADGRLSAKAVMGDRIKLKERQTFYALAMEPFKLERGQSREGVHHETAQEYYKRINYTENLIENIDVNGLFGLQKGKTLEKTKDALKTTAMALQKKEKEVDSLRKHLAWAKENFNNKTKEYNSTLDQKQKDLKISIKTLETIAKNSENPKELMEIATDIKKAITAQLLKNKKNNQEIKDPGERPGHRPKM